MTNAKTIQNLFDKMARIYGTGWRHNSDDGTWLSALHDLTAEQMTRAVNYCTTNLDYPPSIPQFRKAAAGFDATCKSYLDFLDAYAMRNLSTHKQRSLTDKQLSDIVRESKKDATGRYVSGLIHSCPQLSTKTKETTPLRLQSHQTYTKAVPVKESPRKTPPSQDAHHSESRLQEMKKMRNELAKKMRLN